MKHWNHVDETAKFLAQTLGPPPRVAIILGSGLSDVGAALSDARTVAFHEIPHWPPSTVAGHPGTLRCGHLADTPVALQLGRVHFYEGHSPADVVLPIRALVTWGVTNIILTNAAGGINEDHKPGSLMLIEDHLNLTGQNPLLGPNDDQRGPRFPDMSEIYDRALRDHAMAAAAQLNISLHVGVYAGLTGPSYETPAEIRMLRRLGADAVGMSTVLEAIAARHMGARVLGISSITNAAAGLATAPLSHDDVQLFAARAAENLARLLAALLTRLGS